MIDLDQAVREAAQHAQQGRLDAAIPALQQVLQQDPRHVEALRFLGLAMVQSGQPEQGLTLVERAVELAPKRGDLQFLLGSILAHTEGRRGELGRAIEVLRLAIDLGPPPPPGPAHALLATCLLQTGDTDGAEDHYAEALAHNPQHAEARTNYAMVMNQTGRSHEAVRLLRDAVKDHPTHLGALTNYCVALNYAANVEPDEIIEAHRRYGRMLAGQPVTARQPILAKRDPEKRLRVGIVSPDLYDHSVAYFVAAMLEARDQSQVEYWVYATSSRTDEMTERLRLSADRWRELVRIPDAQLVDQIRRDEVDIVLELSGLTQGHRLTALRMRAAPVQITYIGYPNTTGVAAIDDRIVDAITDPPPPHPSDSRATERLIRLDGCFLCFAPRDDAPDLAPPPRVADGHITFGSFNSVKKITPLTVKLWASVLHAVPRSRLVVKSGGLSSRRAREHLSIALRAEGIAEVRFDLLDRIESKLGHLAAYELMDIGLDTFPYNGTTTTCEALWMGVPVVTMAGELHAGRVGASLLSAAGLGDLVADSPEQFAHLAAKLAGDVERLKELRTGLRRQMAESVLCDAPAFARRFEAALRHAWRRECATARESGYYYA